MSDDLEALITKRIEDLAETPMFPEDLTEGDFALRAVLDWLGDVKSLRILDLGCAKGRYVKTLSGMGARVVGADPAWKLIRQAAGNARGCPLVVATATRLPFAASGYDGVLCVEVIEHIPEVDRAIEEIARVLKPGGRAIIVDKNLLGIGFHWFYPNWLYKAALERLDRWPYPKDFPFRERWYTPWSLSGRLRPHFARVETRYLDGRVKGLRRRLLFPVLAVFPFLRPDVAWCCER